MPYQASKATPLWSVGIRWFMAVFHRGKLVRKPKRCRLRGLIRHRPLPLPPHSKKAVGCHPASGASEMRLPALDLGHNTHIHRFVYNGDRRPYS